MSAVSWPAETISPGEDESAKTRPVKKPPFRLSSQYSASRRQNSLARWYRTISEVEIFRLVAMGHLEECFRRGAPLEAIAQLLNYPKHRQAMKVARAAKLRGTSKTFKRQTGALRGWEKRRA